MSNIRSHSKHLFEIFDTRVHFHVRKINEPNPECTKIPCIVLTSTTWNDYGYRTQFNAKLFHSYTSSLDEHRNRSSVELGKIKVMHSEIVPDDRQVHLPREFDYLPQDYASIGESLTYYELLAEYGIDRAGEILHCLRDVATNREYRNSFERHPAYVMSLMRSKGANLSLDQAQNILSNNPIEIKHEITGVIFYDPNIGRLEFPFSNHSSYPGRIQAIIGHNGSGKTSLLSNLAMAATVDESHRQSDSFIKKHGSFGGKGANFSAVMAISFSSFDSFPTPALRGGAHDELAFLDYYYCGLRKPNSAGRLGTLLMSANIRHSQLRRLMDSITIRQNHTLNEALKMVSMERSMDLIGVKNVDDLDRILNKRNAFRELSSGHQIVISTLIHLCASLQVGSLVLFDEPETHLHPPLLTALLQALQFILRERSSVAVIATHSPIVLQELPSKHVLTLVPGEFSILPRVPTIETFGNSLDTLSKMVFHLDELDPSYSRHMRAMMADGSADMIIDLIPNLSRRAKMVNAQILNESMFE